MSISARQKDLIKRLQRDRRIPINIFTHFLHTKPENEPLDLVLIDYWQNIRDKASVHLPVEYINKIDSVINNFKETIDPEAKQLVFRNDSPITILIGAGASAPEPSNIPTVNELLPELWQRAQRIGAEHIDRLVDWCKEKEINNIEDLLTAAYIANFVSKNSSVTSLLDYFLFNNDTELDENIVLFRPQSAPKVNASSIALFQDTLQTLFGLLTSTMIPAQPNKVHDAIVEFLKLHHKTSIITTNYDGCMDEAIIKAGIKINSGPDLNEPIESYPDLIKIHGSINWAYCESCQHVREFDLCKLKSAFVDDILSYAVIGICKNCGGQRRPLLVPPLAIKFIMFPNLIGLWNRARVRIEESDLLIVVGYSFSESDAYITKIISKSLAINPKQRMLVVDRNPNLVLNLRKKFGSHIEGFDQKRIIKAVGDCEKLLPEILENIKFEQDQPEEQVAV